jgi:hypothetical protein
MTLELNEKKDELVKPAHIRQILQDHRVRQLEEADRQVLAGLLEKSIRLVFKAIYLV